MWLKLGDYARLYDVHPDTVRAWIRHGFVQSKRRARTVFVWEEGEPQAVIAVLVVRRNTNGHRNGRNGA